ncbi:MAG: DUF2478 domain-containing protein [Pseudomonadota bacterium]
MRLASTSLGGGGDMDRLLFTLAETLMTRGIRPAGVVQVNTDRSDGQPCDMDVCVLGTDTQLRISQSLGAGARGCRLDPQALETAVALVLNRLAAGADCLIINKFGKQEALGRGFRSVIAEALSLDIPVLVGVNPNNLDALEAFAEGLHVALPPEIPLLADWLSSGAAEIAAETHPNDIHAAD